MLKILFPLLSFVFIGATSRASLTLKESIDKAIQQNPTALKYKEKLVETDSNLSLARASLFPTLTAKLSGLTKKDAVNGGNSNFNGEKYNLYTASLNLSQPLYVGGALTSGYNYAKSLQEIAQKDYDIATRDLTSGVISAYYTVLLNQEKVDIYARIKKIQGESLQTANQRYNIGRGQLLDVLQVKTQNALLESKIAQSNSDLKTAATALLTLIGTHESTQLDLSGSLNFVDLSKATAVVNADSKKNPKAQADPAELFKNFEQRVESGLVQEPSRILEFDKIAAQVKSLESLTAVEKAKNWPTLYALAQGARTGNSRSDLASDYANSWYVGLELTIPLFSGFSSFAQDNIYDSQIRQIQADQLVVKDKVTQDEIKSRNDLASLKVIIQTSAQALKYAQDAAREAQKNYRLATIDYLQFLTVQQSLSEAELAFAQAEYDYIMSYTKFISARGQSLGILVQALADVKPSRAN